MENQELNKQLRIQSEYIVGILDKVSHFGDMNKFCELLTFYAKDFKEKLESVS